jgi:hypothetical protein
MGKNTEQISQGFEENQQEFIQEASLAYRNSSKPKFKSVDRPSAETSVYSGEVVAP